MTAGGAWIKWGTRVLAVILACCAIAAGSL